MVLKLISRTSLAFFSLCFSLLLAISAMSQSVSDSDQPGQDQQAPQQLAQIAPNIVADQVVGHAFRSPAQLFLLDDTGAFVLDYDIEADPITLVVSRGALSQALLNDSSLYSGGVVDFLSDSIFFTGKSGPVTLTASNSTITSQGVILSFSGYDIGRVTGAAGDSLISVVSDVVTTANVTVVNGGNLTASVDPSLKAYFASGGGSVKNFFNPTSGGQPDTLTISLPTGGLPQGQDTLVLVLESQYQPGSVPLNVVDTVRLPVEVLPPVSLSVVDDELLPDSVYPGLPFTLGFDLEVQGLTGPIDSSFVTVSVIDPSDLVLQDLYSGKIAPVAFDGTIATYEMDSVVVDTMLVGSFGQYGLSLDISLYASGNLFSLDSTRIDTLNVVPISTLEYSPASLFPMKVNAGESATFSFDLMLDGTRTVFVDDLLSSFRITGPGFNVNTSLKFDGDSLVPGINPVSSEEVQIPGSLEGDTLAVTAKIVYAAAGTANQLEFSSTLDSAHISVEQLPVVRIIEATVSSYNAPTVNAGQPFEIAVKITNLSSSVQPAFELLMESDGESIFDSSFTADSINGGDTVTFHYPVTAGQNSTASEIFRVEPSPEVQQLPPLDNLATVTIQQPATLSLSRVLFDTQQGFVEPGDEFSIAVNLTNIGEAGTDFGLFTLTTNGLDLGIPDPTMDTIRVGVAKGFTFTAPSFDTTIKINFSLTKIPLDRNTGMPALVGDTAFTVNLQVASLGFRIESTVIPAESNLLVPGVDQELFTLRLKNLGSSAINNARLDNVCLRFTDLFNKPTSVHSSVQVGNTDFLEDGHIISTATAGGDELRLSFNNFLIGPGETVELLLQTRAKIERGEEFKVRLNDADIDARIVNGPLIGLRVPVMSRTPEQHIVVLDFTAIGPSLDESFVVETNPYDPADGQVEFRYFLESPDKVEFRILTLIGEEVYSRDFAAGNEGARPGQNSVFWDGRNDEGHIVLNGVYIVVVSQPDTDTRATLKLAVAK